MAHNNLDKQKAVLPTGSEIFQRAPTSVKPHSDAARIARDVVNGLPNLVPKPQPAGLTPGLTVASQSLRKLQKAWAEFHAHVSPPSSKPQTATRQGDNFLGSPGSNSHNGSSRALGLEGFVTRTPALPVEPKDLRTSLSLGKVNPSGPASGVGIQSVENDAAPQTQVQNKRSADAVDELARNIREAKRLRQGAQSPPEATLSTSRLSTASVPQTSLSAGDSVHSPRPESSSSSGSSIPFARSGQADLLDPRRPIRIRDSESESGLSDDTDSAPEGPSHSSAGPSAGRPLRHRATLPVYNLKQLSGRPIRKKSTTDIIDKDDDEDLDAFDGVNVSPVDLDDDLGDLEYDESRPLRFCGDRPYGEWVGIYDGKQTRVLGGGALFPAGYSPLFNDELPWPCPVRDCKKQFRTAVAVGGHFNMAHRAALLNDNGDGTMTVLGKRELPEPTGRYPAIVVSAVTLRSNGKDTVGELRPTKSNTKAPINAHVPSKDRETLTLHQFAAKSTIWLHLLEMLPKPTTLPAYPAALQLLVTQRQRRAVPASVRAKLVTRQVDLELDVRFFCSLLIYLTGSGGLCNHCGDPKRVNKTFDSCIALHPLASPSLKKTFGASVCCNCYLDRPTPPCVMVRSNLIHPESTLEADQVDDSHLSPRRLTDIERKSNGTAGVKEGPGANEEQRLTKWQATRQPWQHDNLRPSLPRASSKSKPTGIAPVPTPTHPRRPYLQKASTSTALAPAQPDTSTLTASLELEEWELAPGRVRDETGDKPENIAFSTAFLSQDQTVTVAQDITFRVQMIKPGCSVKLAVEPNRLRICSVASGKVRVKVSGQDFAVGPNGVWKVKAGAECAVTNRYYLDAVVHISCVPCDD